MQDSYECELCGMEVSEADSETHDDLAHEVIVSRDGSRGIYLSEVFVEDACAILKVELPTDWEEVKKAYYDPEDFKPSEGSDISFESMDYLRETYESLLGDKGFLTEWNDGYLIYRTREPYVLLSDGETFTSLEGCRVVWASSDTESLKDADLKEYAKPSYSYKPSARPEGGLTLEKATEAIPTCLPTYVTETE